MYTLLVISIVLPFHHTVQAQMNQHPGSFQSKAITTNKQQPLTSDISSTWYNDALKNIQQLEDQIKPERTQGCFSATNLRSRTGFYISPDGYKVEYMQQPDCQVAFQLKGIGRSAIQWTPGNNYSIVQSASQLLYKFDKLHIEYINSSVGLRQNFLVNSKIQGEGALKVTIQPETALHPRLVNNNSLAFYSDDNKMQLSYEDLHVWDANHKELPAAMHFNNGLLTIEVDDAQATYPVTIDPLNKTPEWTTSANGLISNLTTLQINSALYGYAVTGLGDVNGDGYGDAAISAPALTNIFSGSGSLASVGAVFVFYGSPTGLSTTPAKTLQPNTAVAGALFGTSVDAGDVTGDGINDIIIGAPLDSYSTTATGILGGTTTVTVKAGKVYVYPGGNLAAPNPTNFLEIYLQGTGFFSNALLSSNISVNALFGFSVAATGDLDGDNKSDIIVGAPAYVGVSSAIKNGAAFVYYSGDLTTHTPVQLQAPSASLLGLVSLPLLQNGLFFGFSVDGVGDYNNDGYADVVASAPAGVDLSSLGGLLNGQILSGTAYVYYGTGSGITNTVGVTLKPKSGNLFGNAANLFGYKVKGIKGINGNRNGNIAIGAPTGGLIPNALSLTIQAGNVHVFKKKANSSSVSDTSNQVLVSPRSTSLLSILNTLDLNILFGAAIDNAYDINCDGIPDLVVGEPLSSGATLAQLQANAVGGAVYAFLGDGTGTYVTTPVYTVSADHGGEFLSVNAVSLFGFSVAGVPKTRGLGSSPRILVGSPSAALDFDNSLLNLGSTLGLLFDFVAGDNGPGKAFLFNTQLCAGEAPLPVTLEEFKGQEKNTIINLYWKTSHEENLSRFAVERSRDGVHFESIGIVFPWDDANHIDYAFTDKSAIPGNNYYRLKMIDNNAAYKYSGMLTFTLVQNRGANVGIAPNPIVDKICLQFTGLSENTYRIELRNVMGQKFVEKSITITGYRQTEYLMRTVSMTPGIYFLTVFGKNNKKVASNRVIVL